jgi:hypothetical protein
VVSRSLTQGWPQAVVVDHMALGSAEGFEQVVLGSQLSGGHPSQVLSASVGDGHEQ